MTVADIVAPTGWLDAASPTRASGWANAPVCIHVNGELVETVTPSIVRADLGSRARGFDVKLDPLRFRRGANDVRVSFADTGATLSAKTVELAVSPSLISGCSLAAVTQGFWTLSDMRRSGDGVEVSGWYVAPLGAKSASVSCDGERLAYSAQPDIALQRQTWLPPEAPVHRFEARYRFTSPTMRLSFGLEGRAFNPNQDWLIPRESALQPNRDQIRRVSGGFDGFKFDLHGITHADRLACVYERHISAPISNASVLDWGVGAGRVARYMNALAGDFHGADVDADNLEWCRDHLRGTYHHIATTTPTKLPSARFDLIYGVSVMTHLTADAEAAWIAELRRLIKPDGLVLLTILGPTSLMAMDLSHCHTDLARDGRIDLGENTILAGRVPDGYYRNVAHSFASVHAEWGAHFDVLDVLPAAVGIQDLVVLRPR